MVWQGLSDIGAGRDGLATASNMTEPRTYFALTAGRTGTAWLAEFLSQNLGFDVVHEPMEIDDFGLNMPDIRTMRHFNTYGNDATVQDFWHRKFEQIRQRPVYGETNHTLAKCGLLENLVASPLAGNSTVILLRRNLVKQCVSHLVRHDFVNVTTAWQWYLHPHYVKRLVTPKPFLALGTLGMAVWYCYEMAARQSYYALIYSDHLTIIETDLEDLVTEPGAQTLLDAIGAATPCALPPPKNQNAAKPAPELVEKVTQIFQSVAFDAHDIAKQAIADGFSFAADAEDAVPMVRTG